MPIKLSDIGRDMRTIDLEWEGDSFSLTYRPSKYSPEVESAFVEALTGNLPGNAFAQVLAEMIVSWDVLDENGEEIGHDLETLGGIYTGFLGYIFNQITDDQTAAREDRKNFAGGSRRAARSAPARKRTR